MHAPVTTLGHGRRVGLWVQGCTLACPGCASRDTWAAEGGREIPVEVVVREIVRAGAGCDGLTVSGGEPLQQARELTELVTAVRADPAAAGWDILVFTGLTEPEWDPAQREAVELVDAVVAGRYRAGEAGDRALRASANQRLLTMSPLGRSRYGGDLPARPRLQAVFDENGLTMIGLPRPGDLGRMERELRRRGVVLKEVSWRG